MSLIDAVGNQIRHDRTVHRQRRQYELVMNAATAQEQIAPYLLNDLIDHEAETETLRLAHGRVKIIQDNSLPDGFAMLVAQVPS
jgi:hypothetical protein